MVVVVVVVVEAVFRVFSNLSFVIDAAERVWGGLEVDVVECSLGWECACVGVCVCASEGGSEQATRSSC